MLESLFSFVNWQMLVSKKLTVDSGQWTVDSGQWTVNNGQLTASAGMQNLRVAECRMEKP